MYFSHVSFAGHEDKIRKIIIIIIILICFGVLFHHTKSFYAFAITDW